nr:G protein-coupled receptor [Proales similis]
MLRRAFSIILMLSCVWRHSRFKADNSNSSVSECLITIRHMNHKYRSEISYKRLNQTSKICDTRPVVIKFQRFSEDEPGGERLNHLKHISPSIDQISNLKRLVINLFGGRGMSINFRIPTFSTVSDLFIEVFMLDLRLLFRNGTEVRIDAFGPLKRGPFSFNSPLRVKFYTGNRYHLNTCPLMFEGAFISFIEIFGIADSTVKHNMLAFETTNRTLSSTVDELKLLGYGLRFDSRTFPLSVYGKTETAGIHGMVNSFEASALIHSAVVYLMMYISRLRRFFHNNPGWLNEANRRETNRTLMIGMAEPELDYSPKTRNSRTGYITWIESIGTDPFDDSSFCIFYQIEQYLLDVFLVLELEKVQFDQNCSCLLFWLGSKHMLYKQGDHFLKVPCINEIQLNSTCDFNKMSKRCRVETIEPVNYQTIYETILDLEFFKYLADVWLVPVTSLLGIFANLMVIRTFRKIKRSPEYRRNKLTDKGRFMWEYTYYNSWFILFHSLIFLFGPLTTCIEVSGIYCSSFILTDFFRPFYLFIQKFLGNTFRLAANMTSTLFVLFRFGLNTDRLIGFRKVKPKKLVACLCILSLSMSLITLFVNEKLTVFTLSDYPIEYFVNSNTDFLSSGTFLKTGFLLNTFFLTTLFALSNIFIDLRLLSLLRSQNTERRKEEAEKRITKMVILNGLFSFLFRLPEMISAALLLVYTLDQYFFPVCIIFLSPFHSVCPMLFSISHFLLTISYLENLVLLYLFNDNFRKHFHWPFKAASTLKQTHI